MARSDITLAEQFEKRKNWKKALVDCVGATFLYRERLKNGKVFSALDTYELLVTERLKGSETGQFQAHHGGFMETTDVDDWDGACREVAEEIGYNLAPDNLRRVTSIGPCLFRSELEIISDKEIRFTISDVEAEPNVAFILPLFSANVTGLERPGETDGEVTGGLWMTPREIITRFGSKGDLPYSQFNYFQYLVPLLQHFNGERTYERRAISQPGVYTIPV